MSSQNGLAPDRVDFSKIKTSIPIPNLIEVQKNSYEKFLQMDLLPNERDDIGPDLVPDYMTSVKDGAFYGWPWSYFGSHLDPRVHPKNPDMVAKAIKPDYGLSSHVAALGLVFSKGQTLRDFTTRRHYAGRHRVEILVNGRVLGQGSFQLET